MHQSDAYKFLASELNAFRSLSYAELAQLVGESSSQRRRAEDSTEYVVEVKVRWRDCERGEILVEGVVAVSDYGPMRRLDKSFVVMPPVAP